MRTGLKQFLTKGSLVKNERSLSRSHSQSSLSKQQLSSTSILMSSRKKMQINNSEESDYYEPYSYRKRNRAEPLPSFYNSREEEHKKKYRAKEQVLNQSLTDKSHFSGARKEMREYIIKLSNKLKSEIATANATLELFNKNIKRTVDSEYTRIQQSIIQMVEAIWKEEQTNVLKLVKEKTKVLIADLSETKKEMEQMHEKLKRYESELSGDNWKKAMREIVNLEVEDEVALLIEKSQNARDMKAFRLGVSQQKLENFEDCLQDILYLDVNIEGVQSKSHYLRAR